MKTKIRRLLLLAPVVVLVASFAAIVSPPKNAAADSGYAYTDTTYKAISGEIGSTNVRFKESGTLTYEASDDQGCTATIQTKSRGARTGTLRYGDRSNCGDFGGRTGTIKIALPAGVAGTGSNYIGKWVDHSVITVNGETFIDNKIDDTLIFTNKDQSDDCSSQDKIDGFADGSGVHPSHASDIVSLHLHKIPGGGNNKCLEYIYKLSFDDSTKSNYNLYFSWQDAGTISTSDETGIIFAGDGNGRFLDDGSGRSGDAQCQSYITADVGAGTGTLVLRTSGGRELDEGWGSAIADAKLGDNGQGCNESDPIKISMANPKGTDGQYASQREAGSSDVASGGGNSTGAPTLSCNAGWNPLNWLVCAAVNGMVNIANGLENTVDSLLSVGTPGNKSNDANEIFCDSSTTGHGKDTCMAYHKAWNSFRLIALGLMVIAGLVMVIAQAFGMEVLDAYTVRKVLPRLLAAAILLTLSWQLMGFFVNFTNALGYGVRWLIYQPFHGLQNAHLDLGLGGGGGYAVDILGFGALAALGVFGLLSFAGTAALALFIAFIVLVLRQLLLVVLIVFAPIAIVAYILPNTKKMFDLWWDFFAKALLMFPLITAFIAAGRVFSAVATSYSDDTLGQFIAFAAYFAPYFLLPLTFRFAGGALRNIGGFINDRSRGGFDRLRNYRTNKTKQNWQAIQENRRFNPNAGGIVGRVNRRLNTGLSATSDPLASAKIYGGGALRQIGFKNSVGQGVLNQIEQQKFDHSQKLGQKLNGLGFNDRALTTLMGMDRFSAGDIRGAAARLRQQGIDNNDNNAILGASQLERNATWLSTDLSSDAEMGRADIGMGAALAVTAQGFSSAQEVAGLANRRFKNTGLADMMVATAQLNGQRAGRLDMSPGYGIQQAADGSWYGIGLTRDANGQINDPMADVKTKHQIRRWLKTGAPEIQQAKAGSFKEMEPGLQRILTAQFDESGTAFDATGQKITTFGDDGQERDLTKTDVDRMAAMLGSAVGDFSGTSTDGVRELMRVYENTGNRSKVVEEAFNRGRREIHDPRRHGGTPDSHGGEPETGGST